MLGSCMTFVVPHLLLGFRAQVLHDKLLMPDLELVL